MPEYHVPKINGLPILDPKALAEGCVQSNLPVEFWLKANSITNPIGMEPGVAFFVVSASTLDALDKNGQHSITWEYNNGN
ncbi:MAG: hypothetical protein WCK00_12995, partial [Deltaproteobacteria bacterium]